MIVLLLALGIILTSCAAEAGPGDSEIVTDPRKTTTTEYKKPPQVTTTKSDPESTEKSKKPLSLIEIFKIRGVLPVLLMFFCIEIHPCIKMFIFSF